MRFTASAKDLGAALDNAMACAETRTTIPILSHVLVEARGSTVSITASDLDREVRLVVPAQVQEPGTEAVEGRLFHSFVKCVKGADIALQSIEGGVKLTSGRPKAEIPSLPREDFPSLGRGNDETAYVLDGPAFQKAVSSVSTAASTEETRYYLCGVYLHAEGEKWISVATDGHRLHKNELGAPGNDLSLPAVILPAKSVQLVQKLFSGAGEITLCVSPSRIVISTGSATLNSKLIDGSFPDYKRVIPQDQPYKIKASRSELIEAIGRASIASDAVKFTFGGGTIRISGTANGNTMSSDEVDAACGSAGFEIGATAKYLTAALDVLDGDEVEISLTDSSSPMVFRGGRDGPLSVVMPRRV